MKPILFKTDMVRGLLNGTKTVTRRVVKPQPPNAHMVLDYDEDDNSFDFMCGAISDGLCIDFAYTAKASYRPGDILYVRETWTHTCIHCEHYPDMFFCPPDCGTCPEFAYKADGGSLGGWPDKRWHPSIHMPREAARIFLRVTDVRVERLQDITPEQIDAEGCKEFGYSVETGELMPSSPCYFSIVWNNTVKKADRALYGWEANPWVWVIEFERCEKPEGD